VASALYALQAVTSYADGNLPPLPYRYLHPPPALAQGNQPPVPLIHVIPSDYLKALTVVTVFTPDSQAGVTGPRGSFRLVSGSTSLVLRIRPVEIPPGLPQQVAADGNAYEFEAQSQPSGRPATLARGAKLETGWPAIILKYPHIPIAMYRWDGRAWSQICYENLAVVTSSTIACDTRQLGIFVAATTSFNAQTPATVSTPWYRLNPYIPVLAALLLIAAAIALGFAVTRPGPGAGSGATPKKRRR
jgi:hypothetical protein